MRKRYTAAIPATMVAVSVALVVGGGSAVGGDPAIASAAEEARQLDCPDGVVKIFHAGLYVASDEDATRPASADAALDRLLSEHYPKLPRDQVNKVAESKADKKAKFHVKQNGRFTASFVTEEAAPNEYRVEEWSLCIADAKGWGK